MAQGTRQEQLKTIHDKAKDLLNFLHKGNYEEVKKGLEEIMKESAQSAPRVLEKR